MTEYTRENMPDDLRWLAENVSEWLGSFGWLGVRKSEAYWGYTESDICKYDKEDWLSARQQLGLEPAGVLEGETGASRTAEDFLHEAAELMAERGKQYDQKGGERSMGKTVNAFNAITGKDLTESEGWLLMSLLKRVRQHSGAGYHKDSAEDAVAYAALEAESLEAQK